MNTRRVYYAVTAQYGDEYKQMFLKSVEVTYLTTILAGGADVAMISRVECDVDEYVEKFGESHGGFRQELRMSEV